MGYFHLLCRHHRLCLYPDRDFLCYLFHASLSAARLIWIAACTPLVFSKRFIVWAFEYERSHDYSHPGNGVAFFLPLRSENVTMSVLCESVDRRRIGTWLKVQYVETKNGKKQTLSVVKTEQASSLIFLWEQLVYLVMEQINMS